MSFVLAASSWDWAPAILPLVGVFIGAVAAVVGGAFAQWFNRQLERQSLAAALAGEIQCVVESTNWRDAREDIEQDRVVPVDEHAFPIFEANVAKIGLLPVDLAGKVAVFYSELGAIFQDFRTLRNPIFESSASRQFETRFLQRMDAAEKKAKVLLIEPKKEAARPWYYYMQPTE